VPSLRDSGLFVIPTRHCRAFPYRAFGTRFVTWSGDRKSETQLDSRRRWEVPSLAGLASSFIAPGTSVPGFHITCLRHWGRGSAGSRHSPIFSSRCHRHRIRNLVLNLSAERSIWGCRQVQLCAVEVSVSFRIRELSRLTYALGQGFRYTVG